MDLLLLDLDDTLLDDRSAIRQALEALLAHHGIPCREGADPLETWWTISLQQWARFERGELDFQGMRRERVRIFLGTPMTDAAADDAFRPYEQAYERAWALVPEAEAFLARTASIPKVIVTNGFRDQQRRKLQSVGLEPHISALITPEDCGAWKPDPVIFQSALASQGALPTRCAMIGDDETRDIAPALGLGMAAFRVAPATPGRSLLDALDHLGL